MGSEPPLTDTDHDDAGLDALYPQEPEDPETPEEPVADLDWWHRDHPTFLALAGFFSGLLLVTVVPGLFFGTLSALSDERTAEEAFPFVLLFVLIPIGLLMFPSTRRFGKYLVLGMVMTLAVVVGVTTVVVWLMLRLS